MTSNHDLETLVRQAAEIERRIEATDDSDPASCFTRDLVLTPQLEAIREIISRYG
jgi:hypothetical protein